MPFTQAYKVPLRHTSRTSISLNQQCSKAIIISPIQITTTKTIICSCTKQMRHSRTHWLVGLRCQEHLLNVVAFIREIIELFLIELRLRLF